MTTPKIAFFGTPEFSARLLEHIVVSGLATVSAVVCQPDRPSGRSQKTLPPPVKSVAEKYQIPCIQPTSVKKEINFVLEFLKKFGPLNLNLVVAFGQILPKDVLNAATYGSCNIHASLLPRWRGAAPIQRAIEAGDEESGICLMQMDEGLDTGSVYVRQAISLSPKETFATLHDTLCMVSKRLLDKDLIPIANGELSPSPQSSHGITYAQKISSIEAHIDWSKPAAEVERMLRAFDPAPGAYTLAEGKRLKVFRAILLGRSSVAAQSGEVLAHDRSGVLVCCGDGHCLLLQEMQLEGKRRQDSHEFGNGTAIPKGIVLA